MKNIQIIDGAENCTYDIFAVSEELFNLIFPNPGQNIEFIEDVLSRITKEEEKLFSDMWKHRVLKKEVIGIHGTLFYELQLKKEYYPTKIDSN